MNLRLPILIALAVGAGRVSAAEPVATPAAPPRSVRAAVAAVAPARNESSVAPSVAFDAFRLITDRNIFNPNRTGRRERSTEEVAPPRLETISLVGTMDSDHGGLRALFDGSDRSYRKTLHVGDSVGDFKVVQIRTEGVDLEHAGKTVSMRVGQQFRKPDGGEWTLVGADVVRQEAQARASASSGLDPSAPVAIPADADEVTRRMMERRNKTLKP